MYKKLTPSGTAGISMFAVAGSSIFKLLECFESNRDVDSGGLYYGIINKKNSKPLDEVLIVFEPEKKLLFITSHGGAEVEREVAMLFRQLDIDMDPGLKLSACSQIHSECLDCIRHSLSRTGAACFSGYIQGGLEHCIENILEHVKEGTAAYPVQELKKLIKGWRVRYGFVQPPVIALIGPENVGKSTLFNRIVGFERMVVTEIPGTTGEYVDETVLIDDYPFTFRDSMGLPEGEADFPVHYEKFRETTDYAVLVTEGGGVSKEAERIRELFGDGIIAEVRNKSDRCSAGTTDSINISALHNKGISKLTHMIYKKIVGSRGIFYDNGFFTPGQAETGGKALDLIQQQKYEKAYSTLSRLIEEKTGDNN